MNKNEFIELLENSSAVITNDGGVPEASIPKIIHYGNNEANIKLGPWEFTKTEISSINKIEGDKSSLQVIVNRSSAFQFDIEVTLLTPMLYII